MEKRNSGKGGAVVEPGMIHLVDEKRCRPAAKGGFMLVTVLIVTAIGLLFGAGSLLLFRYQCQMRIERQHELEKVYAVRSALNYIIRNANSIDDEGRPFRFHTGSGRDLGLLVKPVRRIFPDFDRTNTPYHFDMGDEMKKMRVFGNGDVKNQYSETLDYEYGAERWNEGEDESALLRHIVREPNGYYGLGFKGLAEINSPRWWVNIGMSGTGGWLQDDYGRRYSFRPETWVAQSDSEKTKDIMRFCLIRNGDGNSADSGRKHGWPLSKEGARALVLEIRPGYGLVNEQSENAEMVLSEYGYAKGRGGVFEVTNHLRWAGVPCYSLFMGLQIAGDKMTAFYIRKGGGGGVENELKRGYVFSDTCQLTPDTYDYFANGSIVDSDGRIKSAPELRAVFEVEGVSNKRSSSFEGNDDSEVDSLSYFRVTPAYQYDVFLEHPAGVTNLATVAQRVSVSKAVGRTGEKFSVFTYDTHGTDHKGFRHDERSNGN